MPDPVADEGAFRRWYAEQARRYDLDPNPDSPEQFYDWRAAFRADAKPDASLHWPSDFKKPGHPNEIVGGFNTRTGERVRGTPRAKSVEELVSKGWNRETAIQLMAMPEQQTAQASDPVADILRTVQTSDRLRAAAWDAAYSSDDPDAVATALQQLPIGDRARAKLWDVRFAEAEPLDAAVPETPTLTRLFGAEPMTGREFLDAQAANTAAVSHLAGEHPVATGLGLAAIGGGPALARAALGRAPMAKTAVTMAAPYAKYYGVKHALLSVGIPPAAAEAMAVAASGYRRRPTPTAPATATPGPPAPATPAPVDPMAAGMSRGTTTAAENAIASGRMVSGMSQPSAASAASPAPPVASTPAVSVSAVPASTPATAGAPIAGSAPSPLPRSLSPQRIQNDLGIAARRAKVTLTEPQYQAAADLVRQGKTPADAVTEIAATRTASPAPTAQAPKPQTTPSKRLRMTADEADEYLRLTGKGMTNEEAVAALLQQRRLAATLGTPSPETARRRVAERNVTGRWPSDR